MMLLSPRLDIVVIMNIFLNTDLAAESQEVPYGFPCDGT